MLKNCVGAFVFTFTFIGCAHGPMHSAHSPGTGQVIAVDKSPPKVGDIDGNTNGRAPAQAEPAYWIEDSKAISVPPGGTSVTLNLAPRQVQSYEEITTYTCQQFTWGRGTCEEYICPKGTGKSELWNAYYSAPENQKAAKLDQALLGIGRPAAERLHNAGIFSSKAKSWQEFRERMNRALKQKIVTSEQYREVFGTFEQRNKANLGYTSENCRIQHVSCDVYGLFDVHNGCERRTTVQRTIGVANKPVQVNITNPHLQNFETETVTVVAGNNYDSIKVLPADKTVYTLVSKVPTGDGAILNLQGVERIRIPLPSDVLKGMQYRDSRGNSIEAQLTVKPNYIGQGDDKLVLTLEVSHCLPGGFFSFGECKGNDEKGKTKLPPQYHTVSEATSVVQFPSVPPGHRVWASYSLHRENSRWYTDSPSNARTDKLSELKK